ncbi:hypothetical protein DESC_690009 [Desulfosarcina cetonica]|nr:hypothetical protein DESC_690009 [Desulfosarcina cetonica]
MRKNAAFTSRHHPAGLQVAVFPLETRTHVARWPQPQPVDGLHPTDDDGEMVPAGVAVHQVGQILEQPGRQARRRLVQGRSGRLLGAIVESAQALDALPERLSRGVATVHRDPPGDSDLHHFAGMVEQPLSPPAGLDFADLGRTEIRVADQLAAVRIGLAQDHRAHAATGGMAGGQGRPVEGVAEMGRPPAEQRPYRLEDMLQGVFFFRHRHRAFRPSINRTVPYSSAQNKSIVRPSLRLTSPSSQMRK